MWQRCDYGPPILADAVARFICMKENVVSYGTHNVFFGRVIDISLGEVTDPLLYGNGAYTLVASI